MGKISKIIIGTHNDGKFKEIRDLLPKDIKKISPKDLNIPIPEETGLTFEDNSKIKAKFFSNASNLVCISDDSGLEIDALFGSPGIYSSRWAGPRKDFNLAIQRVIEELNKRDPNWVNKQNISAQFICALTVYWPDGKFVTSKGFVDGSITSIKRGTNGFGYDPIFIPKGYKQTFGEMDPKLKYKIDHRANAYLKISKNFFN